VALATLALAACTVEVGPPPESDPPLVPEAATLPPPPQPTGPQAWSRGLDFDSAPAAADRDELARGLVPANEPTRYSGQRLTYESAFNPEKPPSEAELARQRAQERAAKAGLPAPPQVTAAPVTEVEAQALPPADAADEAQAPRRESRLPPPPTFPPAPEQWQETAAVPQPAAAEAEEQPAAAAEPAAPEPWSARNSRLPAPPTFPPVKAPEPEPAAGEKVTVAMEAWDAPKGAILVQVSAVNDGDEVAQEWERLKARHPEVLEPLRLVVEQAQLDGRGVFYRVQAGAFSSREGAAAACDSLISRGQACFVVVR
jgi:hypothetical protein